MTLTLYTSCVHNAAVPEGTAVIKSEFWAKSKVECMVNDLQGSPKLRSCHICSGSIQCRADKLQIPALMLSTNQKLSTQRQSDVQNATPHRVTALEQTFMRLKVQQSWGLTAEEQAAFEQYTNNGPRLRTADSSLDAANHQNKQSAGICAFSNACNPCSFR